MNGIFNGPLQLLFWSHIINNSKWTLNVCLIISKPLFYFHLDVDVVVTDFTYISGESIVRGIPGSYNFSLIMKHAAGKYDISRLSNSLNNFKIMYFYAPLSEDSSTCTNNSDTPWYYNFTLYPGQMVQDEASSALKVSNTAELQFLVLKGMTIEECRSIYYICVLLQSDPSGSWAEANYTTNVRCLDINSTQIKVCSPRKYITLIIIPPLLHVFIYVGWTFLSLYGQAMNYCY